MAIPECDLKTNYIAELPNKPVTDGGLSADAFKKRFDQFGENFKTWFNQTLRTAMISTFATKAVATHSADGLMSTTMYDKLNGIEAGAQVNAVTTVAGKDGDVSLVAADITDLAANRTANHILPIFITTTPPTTASDDGVYLVYEPATTE